MQVKHLSEARPYEAPNHRAYCSLRLFGLDAGGPRQFTVGAYAPLALPLLALAGIAVAVLGAALPAWMAARSPAATVLHTE